MAAAIPFAIKAGTMIGGSLLGKKLSGPSGGQKEALAGQKQGAQMIGQYASPLVQQGLSTIRQGTGYMNQAGNYYGNILNNRRAASESLAPEMKTTMDYYSGAARKAGRTMQGGARDQAVAELDRERVGNMAMMLPAARANAAQGMGQLANTGIYGGQGITGQGVNAASNAANIYSGMFGNQTTVRNQEQEGGKAWGGFLTDLAKQLPWGKLGGGKSPIPTNPMPTPYGTPPSYPYNTGGR